MFSPLDVEVLNRTRTAVPVAWLRSVVAKAEHALAGRLNYRRLNVVLVGTARMRKLNRHWRGKNQSTDVLSFSSSRRFVWPAGVPEEAEIVIAVPVAWRQARERRVGLRQEIARLVVHGLVHLAGFDHDLSTAEARRMALMEKRIIKKL
ncbi:rRNA maturation RNase YbeY [Candidatus Parcubacteria bacterium]|nr:rRNA maturation RNase YbeY [Candidatus Parcubacteria bacterium]